ncbi:unnamed protein product [Plutella xylostella]|uniref:(diamondback moth) hypothetical protein n=1 Tax=Plutella xylostella TaxID=51655 RepID=A0A8S4EZX6_PLUXY|nr:unnamed protein product [Plutella xylostella]
MSVHAPRMRVMGCGGAPDRGPTKSEKPANYNQLTELPREICQMPLQVLLLPHNQLTSLPKELGRMGSLAELDASNNRLLQVPMTLGDCSSLRALDLSYNQLGLLPLPGAIKLK